MTKAGGLTSTSSCIFRFFILRNHPIVPTVFHWIVYNSMLQTFIASTLLQIAHFGGNIINVVYACLSKLYCFVKGAHK